MPDIQSNFRLKNKVQVYAEFTAIVNTDHMKFIHHRSRLLRINVKRFLLIYRKKNRSRGATAVLKILELV